MGNVTFLDLEDLTAIVKECTFPDFMIEVAKNPRGEMFLQARYKEPDTRTGKIEWQYTRKWLLSPMMTKSEVVQTAFKCVLTSMEHRTREWFQYRGRSIFGPHFDVDKLLEVCESHTSYDGRK